MLRFAADENFNGDIVRGVLRRNPDVDIIRIQDVGLSGTKDDTLLEWAAKQDRILLTHDVNTITRYVYERIQAGKSMPGVVEVNSELAMKQVIEDILLLAECSLEEEWEAKILYLPLR
ncbi:MAG: DUF5615 family PIN-like protein [Chloroflexi bacterium]|nr:DUF5615 family PIN-like protein [Chloroflexota bacterium]